jgi:hypothetical protein
MPENIVALRLVIDQADFLSALFEHCHRIESLSIWW